VVTADQKQNAETKREGIRPNGAMANRVWGGRKVSFLPTAAEEKLRGRHYARKSGDPLNNVTETRDRQCTIM
jgi:hypothetical protein